jgi:hypothetical protein
MMQSLQNSVQSVIDGGRIGSPVFIRCMLQLPIAGENLIQTTAALVSLANGWMPSPPERVYAQASTDATQSTTMIQYAGGQTANLSVNRIPADREGSVDLVLIGNKGVVYHETPVGRHRLNTPSIELSGGATLANAIAQAIQTGQPVRF